MVFYKVAAREAFKRYPVALLPLFLTPRALRGLTPREANRRVAVPSNHTANCPVVNPSHCFHGRFVVSKAKPRHNRKHPLTGPGACGSHFVNARHINGHGLLAVEVLSRFNGRFHVQRPHVRRGGEQNDVHACIEHITIRVESQKPSLWRALKLYPCRPSQQAGTGIDLVGKQISHGHDPHAWIGRRCL